MQVEVGVEDGRRQVEVEWNKEWKKSFLKKLLFFE